MVEPTGRKYAYGSFLYAFSQKTQQKKDIKHTKCKNNTLCPNGVHKVYLLKYNITGEISTTRDCAVAGIPDSLIFNNNPE